jgi:hypothetical protein
MLTSRPLKPIWGSHVPSRRAPRTDGAKDLWQNKGELWARNGRVNLVYNCDFHSNCKDIFTCRKAATWDRRLYFLSEGRSAEDFFSPGLNPRTSVPEVSALTTRPPKPLKIVPCLEY